MITCVLFSISKSKVSNDPYKALRGKSIDASLSPVKRFPQIKKEKEKIKKKK